MSSFANLRAPAAFQCFVDDDIQAASGLDKGLDDEREQGPACLQRRPAGSVEHLVKGAEMGILVMAGVPQGRGHGATAPREQGPVEQRQHLLPGGRREQRAKRFEQGYTGGSARHEASPEWIAVWRLLSYSLDPHAVYLLQKCTKSSSAGICASFWRPARARHRRP